MSDKDLLLTPEQIRAIPFYKNTPDEALPYTLLKAQLAKANPIIRKDEKERIHQSLLLEWQKYAKKMWNLDNSQTLPPWVRQSLTGGEL